MTAQEHPAWVIYPEARVRLALTATRERPSLALIGNPQGLASLAGVFLWLTAFSDYGSLSVSGLTFVAPEGALALSIVMELEQGPFRGRVVKRDKDQQFEWQVYDDDLQQVAISLHRIATHSDYDDYLDVSLSPDSEAQLRFEVSVDA